MRCSYFSDQSAKCPNHAKFTLRRLLFELGCTSLFFSLLFSFLLIIMSDHEDVDALFEDDPGPLEEVIDEDDAEDLKLDQAENKVWLVKVKIRQ